MNCNRNKKRILTQEPLVSFLLIILVPKAVNHLLSANCQYWARGHRLELSALHLQDRQDQSISKYLSHFEPDNLWVEMKFRLGKKNKQVFTTADRSKQKGKFLSIILPGWTSFWGTIEHLNPQTWRNWWLKITVLPLEGNVFPRQDKHLSVCWVGNS